MRCQRAVLAVCAACLLLGAAAQTLSGLPTLDVAPAGFSIAQKQVTSVALIQSGQINQTGNGIYELKANDPLILPAAGLTQFTPDQVHVTLGDNGTIWVSWATGTYQNVSNAQAPAYPTTSLYAPQFPDPASVASQVQWSTTAGGPYTNLANGQTRAYIQTYIRNSATYVSQLFHHVNVRNLPFGVPIYYKVGDPAKELSVQYQITLKTSLAPSNTYTYPLRLGLVADIGQTMNSTTTYQHLVGNNPDAVIFVGDLAYADNYNNKGGNSNAGSPLPATVPTNYAGTNVNQGQTFQPRWDIMGRLLQRAGNGSSIPYLFCPGNHEIERDETLRPFQSYTNRFRHSYEASYSTNPLYYSTNIGPVHSIMLNSYDSYLPNVTLDQTSSYLNANNTSPFNSLLLFGNAGSGAGAGSGGPSFPTGNYVYSALGAEQFSWLLNDLARVNRAVTPWVTVSWHQPPYNSYQTHYKEAECLRQMVEPFLYNFGVDVVFHGHIHAYERTYQTYNYQADGCAPRFITIGDGGNEEGLYANFAGNNCTGVAASAACGVPGVNPTPAQAINPAACASFQSYGTNSPLYAPPAAAQPSYSAYREPSFGHAIMTVFNATHALWEWHRNLDNTPVVTDSVYFVRNPKCNNFKAGTPLPTPAPPATLAPSPTVNNKLSAIQSIIDANQQIKANMGSNIFSG